MLKNSELDLLIKMENLIGCNEKMLFNDDGCGINEETAVTKSDFIDFMNLIEKEIQVKQIASNKANAYNKQHKEKHRENNKQYARRKASQSNQ